MNGFFIEHDYALDPPKPTVDGEPRYETIPVGFYYRDVSRYDRFDYSSRGEPFTIDKRVFKPRRLKETWYDPRYGCTYHIHTSANAAFQTYTPPTSGRGSDWILILEEE